MANTVEALESEVAALRQRVKELASKEAQLNLVIASTGVGIWDWYVQSGETEFNERWANIIGYTIEELAPTSIETWMQYAHPDDLEESNRLLQANWAGETEYYIFESRMKHKDGHWVWVLDTGQVIEWESDGVPRRMIGTHLDITAQKTTQLMLDAANKELEALVRIDPLSKLANRRGYDERIEVELATARREQKPLSMLVIDIDHFKKYNDIYGHEEGDIAIQRVARQLKASLRRKTDFIARYGGEEFIMLLPSTRAEDACAFSDVILRKIRALNIEHEASPFAKKLSVSIGVASTEAAADDLFRRADQALYRAKEKGRNQYRLAADG